MEPITRYRNTRAGTQEDEVKTNRIQTMLLELWGRGLEQFEVGSALMLHRSSALTSWYFYFCLDTDWYWSPSVVPTETGHSELCGNSLSTSLRLAHVHRRGGLGVSKKGRMHCRVHIKFQSTVTCDLHRPCGTVQLYSAVSKVKCGIGLILCILTEWVPGYTHGTTYWCQDYLRFVSNISEQWANTKRAPHQKRSIN